LTHDSPDSTPTSPRLQRPHRWALSLCLCLSTACDSSDPAGDGGDLFGAAGRGGASAAGRTDGQTPVGANPTPAPSGIDEPSSTEGGNVGGLAGVGENVPQDAAAEQVADAGAGEAPADAGSTQPSADAAVDPFLDDNVVFIQQDGFQTTYFAQECRAIGADGAVIEGEPLPVGGGNILECVTSVIGALATTDFLASTDERWCALGALDTFSTGGDPSLDIQVADSPDDAPWTLIASHEGEPIEIGRVAVFGGATAWPLWVDTHYAVIDVAPNPTGQLCDTLFGL